MAITKDCPEFNGNMLSNSSETGGNTVNIDTFIINYDPIESKVRFTILKSSGVSGGIADGEPLKDFENNDGIFSLEGQYEKVFAYLKKNFEGKPEVSLKIEVPQLGFNKKQVEFERFEEYVKKFNKSSEIKINLTININRLGRIKFL